jgi:hypothetical protein
MRSSITDFRFKYIEKPSPGVVGEGFLVELDFVNNLERSNTIALVVN